jgi:WhiB family redox-sensing transcriptional regulator
MTAAAAQKLSWLDAAACRRVDSELFFPTPGRSPAAAKRVCAACPVTAHCLQLALEAGIRYGVFGGTTERERRSLLAERRRTPGTGLCGSGLHPRTPESVTASGQCRACKRENWRKHHGTGHGSGNPDTPRERDANGRFAGPKELAA